MSPVDGAAGAIHGNSYYTLTRGKTIIVIVHINKRRIQNFGVNCCTSVRLGYNEKDTEKIGRFMRNGSIVCCLQK